MNTHLKRRTSGNDTQIEDDLSDANRVRRVVRAWPMWSDSQVGRVLDLAPRTVGKLRPATGHLERSA